MIILDLAREGRVAKSRRRRAILTEDTNHPNLDAAQRGAIFLVAHKKPQTKQLRAIFGVVDFVRCDSTKK
jgi:hypothetical protein